jgi:hypothetical protein
MVEEVVWHWRLEAWVRMQDCLKPLLLVWQRYNDSWVRLKNGTLRITLFPPTSIRESRQESSTYTDSPTKFAPRCSQSKRNPTTTCPACCCCRPSCHGNINPNNASLSPTPACFLIFGPSGQSELVAGSLQKTS